MKPPGHTTTQLRDGSYFDLLNPDPAKIVATDIAYTLDKICRFNGRCTRHYGVLEHSIRVWKLGTVVYGMDRDLQAALLLHDAGEAYTGDIIQPVKTALRKLDAGEALKRLEGGIDRAIETRLGLPEGILHDPRVKKADGLALEWERRNLITPLGVKETPPEWPKVDAAGLRAIEEMEEFEFEFQRLVDDGLAAWWLDRLGRNLRYGYK